MNRLEHSYDYCESMIGVNRLVIYKILNQFPEESRRAIIAILAFCSRVNQITYENRPKKEVLQLEYELEQFRKGNLPEDNPMWVALQDVFEKYDMDIQPFEDLLAGQKRDFVKNRIMTVNELLDYGYNLAGAMGLMLLPIIAPGKTDVLRDDFVKLSLAIHLTSILRDIGEDLMKGRIYLPKELFIKYQYSSKEFIDCEINEPFINIWEEIASLAEDFYDDAMCSIHVFPEYSRSLVKGTAYLNRTILSEIRKKGYEVFKKQNYVTDEVKNKVKSIM